MMRVLIVVVSVCLSGYVMAQEQLSSGWHESKMQHDGLMRHFRYYLPENIIPRPQLVILFHGGTMSMRKIFRKRASGTQEWQTLADEYGFLLLVPNGVNVETGDTNGDRQNWNDCREPVQGDNSASMADDVGFVGKLIDWSIQRFHVDPARVYVTGASNGGMMSLRLVTEIGDRIAAAAVFIANQPLQSDCPPARYSVPLMLVNGTADPLIRWQGGRIRDKGPELMSTPQTLAFWLEVNRADTANARETRVPDRNKRDDSHIIKTVYPATADGQPIWFYRVEGGGHTMPSIRHRVPLIARWLVGNQNRDIEGAHEAWYFLRQFSQSSASKQHL